MRIKTVDLIPLSELKVGQIASIRSVGRGNSTMERLRDLGLVPGEQVSILRKAPFGDPIEVRIMNYDLCIRLKEASEIFVQP
ncbi:MAG: ferrous iron transport protein A [Spirochaetia bacterium]|nr:ferrous iron transport protein A [Spirochaetia bacterium]